MCDLHSELVQCSISPLCVTACRDICFLAQASSAHFRKQPSYSEEPRYCIMASSHISLVTGQPLLRGSSFLPAPQSKTSSSTATYTIIRSTSFCGAILIISLIMFPPLQMFRQCFFLRGECDAAHPPALCCCLTGALMAQLCSCCPYSAKPGSCLFSSLPRCATSTVAPGRGKRNLTA